MKRTAVLNVVGLTESLLGPHTPRINALRQAGSLTRIAPSFPAVTCTAQSNFLTGLPPREHGIVANGWYHRELAEVQFWKQSNHVVRGRKLWEELREAHPGFTCAKLFWWFNMYSTADYSITPRPIYPADGRKCFDIYAWPYDIRTEIKKELGEFPFFGFWGPAAGVATPQGAPDATTRWIAEAAKWIERRYAPSLNLVYLPHLDYNLQRLGPLVAADVRRRTPAGTQESASSRRRLQSAGEDITADLARIDAIVGDLADFFARQSVQVIVLSEYGITPVDKPVHLNRGFRERGWLAIREELGLELLDCGASRAFAVADHQVAHVYVNDRSLLGEVRAVIEQHSGVAQVLDEAGKRQHGLDHARSGDLVAIAAPNAWFTYYYWLDDRRAPDFARTVDIHRKPGYDPVELFLDPALRVPKLRIAWRLLQKRLGFRMLMDVIPLDATLVKGSHGARPADSAEWPVLISPRPAKANGGALDSTEVYAELKRQISE